MWWQYSQKIEKVKKCCPFFKWNENCENCTVKGFQNFTFWKFYRVMFQMVLSLKIVVRNVSKNEFSGKLYARKIVKNGKYHIHDHYIERIWKFRKISQKFSKTWKFRKNELTNFFQNIENLEFALTNFLKILNIWKTITNFVKT